MKDSTGFNHAHNYILRVVVIIIIITTATSSSSKLIIITEMAKDKTGNTH